MQQKLRLRTTVSRRALKGVTPIVLSFGVRSEFLALKHESRILGQSSNFVWGFSMMEQVRLCVVWHMENWIDSSLNQIHCHCPRILLSCFRARNSELGGGWVELGNCLRITPQLTECKTGKDYMWGKNATFTMSLILCWVDKLGLCTLLMVILLENWREI